MLSVERIGNNTIRLRGDGNYRIIFQYQNGYLAYMEIVDNIVFWVSKWNQIKVV